VGLSAVVAAMGAAARDAVATILAVYREHAAGGQLHVVLDDWNLDDGALASVAALPLTRAERWCLDALRRLSETDRRIALAAAEVEMERE
jgi:nitrogen fixation protein